MKGITVKLYERHIVGRDAFNAPVYGETEYDVENVLVAPMSTAEVIDTLQLYGKKAVYQLAIPKGDEHEWTGNRVEFFGESWRVISLSSEGIEDLIPLDWNKKIQVARYEEDGLSA